MVVVFECVRDMTKEWQGLNTTTTEVLYSRTTSMRMHGHSKRIRALSGATGLYAIWFQNIEKSFSTSVHSKQRRQRNPRLCWMCWIETIVLELNCCSRHHQHGGALAIFVWQQSSSTNPNSVLKIAFVSLYSNPNLMVCHSQFGRLNSWISLLDLFSPISPLYNWFDHWSIMHFMNGSLEFRNREDFTQLVHWELPFLVHVDELRNELNSNG